MRYKGGAPLMIYTRGRDDIHRAERGDESPLSVAFRASSPRGEPFGKPSFTFVCVRLISASPFGRGGGVADGEGDSKKGAEAPFLRLVSDFNVSSRQWKNRLARNQAAGTVRAWDFRHNRKKRSRSSFFAVCVRLQRELPTVEKSPCKKSSRRQAEL